MNQSSPPSSFHSARNENGELTFPAVQEWNKLQGVSARFYCCDRLFRNTIFHDRPLQKTIRRKSPRCLGFINYVFETTVLLIFVFGLITVMTNVDRTFSRVFVAAEQNVLNYKLSSNNYTAFRNALQSSITSNRELVIISTCANRTIKELVSPEILNRSIHNEVDCAVLHYFLNTVDQRAQKSIELFHSVIKRLSCKPKYNLSSQNEDLSDDTYSLTSACNECENSYCKWVCAYHFPIYNGSEFPVDADNLRILCYNTSRKCPLLIPMDVHSGQPFFICTGVRTFKNILMRPTPCTNKSAGYCYLPHELNKSVNVFNQLSSARNHLFVAWKITDVLWLMFNMLIIVQHI